ncbi:uncharacterized protein LOC100901769 [Galendromus occidentalis]|uniref:Uncharacterized protein LOC100901769 n=1 Tax=Galendromus occidentalis TaxID=34638 RepID=A0AAJ6QRE0_9ACAR|nr:uncharacterized protein LOC100901769 [Galendromus occidentalis]
MVVSYSSIAIKCGFSLTDAKAGISAQLGINDKLRHTLVMFARVLLIAAAASVACGDPAANSLMDRVLADLRNQLNTLGLDPARASPFEVFVPSNGPFNRDLRANFTQGSIVGLGGLVRTGDCIYHQAGSNRLFICNVLLGSTQIMMNVDVQGDSAITVHPISTGTRIDNGTQAVIQVHGMRGYQPKSVRIEVDSITATTRVLRGKLELNAPRFAEFSRQVNRNISAQLVNTLTGPYAQALSSAFARYTMP